MTPTRTTAADAPIEDSGAANAPSPRRKDGGTADVRDDAGPVRTLREDHRFLIH